MHSRPRAKSVRRRLLAAVAGITALAILAIPALALADSPDSPDLATPTSADPPAPTTLQQAAAQVYYPPGARIIVIYISPNGDMTFLDPNGNLITIDIHGNIVAVNGNLNIPAPFTAPGPGGTMGSSNSSCPAGDGTNLIPVSTPNGLIFVQGAGGGVGGWTSNGPWGLTTCVAGPGH